MLVFLKEVEQFLDPIHSIHVFTTKVIWRDLYFSYLGIPNHIEVFINFFLDSRRSAKYYLTPQRHADIVMWMIQHYHCPSPSELLVRQFWRGVGGEDTQMPFAELLSEPSLSSLLCHGTLMDIHLSHASPCAEQLVDVIRFYNPHTFPPTYVPKVCDITV